MRKWICLFALILVAASRLRAQNEELGLYFVFLREKPQNTEWSHDFSEKAIQRRVKYSLPFPAWEDLPLDPVFQKEVACRVNTVRHELRWFNALSVEAGAAQIEEVRVLDCVVAVQQFGICGGLLACDSGSESEDKEPDTLKFNQLFRHQRELLGMELLEKQGLDGKGIRIAIFDAGFKGADDHPAFLHLRENRQILKTKDFQGRRADVYYHSGHGTAVLSCIAGMYEGQKIGMATAAEFLLARTEHNVFERIGEEDNWLAAMEWADREGADIISSSLGYSLPRYEYSDMNGLGTVASRAAAIAVRKGILVVSSAGNEGAGKFRYVSSPGDADSVLTVGASYPMLRYPMPFTSVGPNARGVLKPEISAPGYVLAASKKGDYDAFSGTSFACPLVTGIAACLMQYRPEKSNMEIKEMITKAGHFYPYYDYSMGYGVLNLCRILGSDSVPKPTFKVKFAGDTIWFYLNPEVVTADSAKFPSGKPFSYHFVEDSGMLSGYRTVLIKPTMTRFGIPPQERKEGSLEAWFECYLWRETEQK